MARIVWSSVARDDLKSLVSFIKADSPGYAQTFGLHIQQRVERPPLYRGGSASKKNGLPAPSHPSEAVRCASTRDGLIALFSPCFRRTA